MLSVLWSCPLWLCCFLAMGCLSRVDCRGLSIETIVWLASRRMDGCRSKLSGLRRVMLARILSINTSIRDKGPVRKYQSLLSRGCESSRGSLSTVPIRSSRRHKLAEVYSFNLDKRQISSRTSHRSSGIGSNDQIPLQLPDISMLDPVMVWKSGCHSAGR
jgi:hypothetical protein